MQGYEDDTEVSYYTAFVLITATSLYKWKLSIVSCVEIEEIRCKDNGMDLFFLGGSGQSGTKADFDIRSLSTANDNVLFDCSFLDDHTKPIDNQEFNGGENGTCLPELTFSPQTSKLYTLKQMEIMQTNYSKAVDMINDTGIDYILPDGIKVVAMPGKEIAKLYNELKNENTQELVGLAVYDEKTIYIADELLLNGAVKNWKYDGSIVWYIYDALAHETGHIYLSFIDPTYRRRRTDIIENGAIRFSNKFREFYGKPTEWLNFEWPWEW